MCFLDHDKIASLTGLNTERIADALNDKETMEKMFPLKNQSSSALSMLTFLIGPDARIVDKFVEEIKKIKSGNYRFFCKKKVLLVLLVLLFIKCSKNNM